MLPNFVLIGFMGCGKSTVGKRLAALVGHRFLDSDEIIAQTNERTVPEIFADIGEAGFRDLEAAALADLVGVAGIVLSTGGGAILRPGNRETIHRIGIVVWIDSEPGILFERAMRSGKRPLLQTEDPRATFDRLYAERRGIYEATADIRFNSSHIDQEEVARRVLEEAMRFRAAGTSR